MIKGHRPQPFRGGSRRLSPRGALVRTIHWLRIGVEVVVAIAAVGALAWTWGPPLPGAPAASAAIVPAPPAYDLSAARFAENAEQRAVAAMLGPVVAGRAHELASVRRGDTLASVLERADVDSTDYNAALIALRDLYDPRTLQVGQDIELFLHRADGDGGQAQLIGIAFAPDVDRRIEVARSADGAYQARETLLPLTRRIARAQGSIDESLYADAMEAGASDMVVNDIARLLSHTVDFQREIHPGDTFDIVFEQFLDPDGEIVKTGEIYYIGFTPRGRELAYWRYTPPEDDVENAEVGYYDAKGESARRFLMKTPVNATRISSGFSRSRRHPVLGYTRAHKGTDFAAPTGTPIYAAGNGVVERANVYGSFGNYVRIRHANGYQTIYGHLNGFARGIRAGSRVSQGDVIGYVGMTGTATGPHLHYEVHLNEVAMDPMSLDVPTGRTLREEELPSFEVERAIINALRNRAVPADAAPELMAAAEPEAQLVEIAAP